MDRTEKWNEEMEREREEIETKGGQRR